MVKSIKGSKERMDVMKKIGNLGKWIDGLSEKQCVFVGVVGAVLGSIPVVTYILFDAGLL